MDGIGKSMKRIAIIGHFADGRDFFDGETVSTRPLRDELDKLNLCKKCCFGMHILQHELND